jgi:NAD(P)-dependent dehydrogenase (short-subunit alcohol dehydrogenase family)
VNYRERADAANAVCSEITGIGRKAIAVQADVSGAAAVRRMVAEVEANLAGIDILVNNAAIAHPQRLEDYRSGMGPSAHRQSRVSVLGNAGCG